MMSRRTTTPVQARQRRRGARGRPSRKKYGRLRSSSSASGVVKLIGHKCRASAEKGKAAAETSVFQILRNRLAPGRTGQNYTDHRLVRHYICVICEICGELAKRGPHPTGKQALTLPRRGGEG